MRRLALMAGLLACFAFLAPNASAQDAPVEDFRTQAASLKEMADVYRAVTERERNNRGAKKMLAQLDNAYSLTQKYLSQQVEVPELRQGLSAALRQAKEFPTDNARKAVQIITKLIGLCQRLPSRYGGDGAANDAIPTDEGADTPPETTPADDADAGPITDQAADEPAGPSIRLQDSPGREGSDGLMYLLFGAYLLAVVALGALLMFSQRRQGKLMDARLDKVQERMENIEFASGGTDDFKNVKLNELKKRLDALEQNMADFLERVEVRANETGTALERLSEANQSSLMAAQVAQSKAETVAKLEQRLAVMEERLAGGGGATPTPPRAAAPTAPTKPRFMPDSSDGLAESLDSVLGHLNTLHDRTRMMALQKRIEVVSPLLERAKNSAGIDPEDLGQLGRLLQLCYTASLNEGLVGEYKQLCEAAGLLGVAIEDSMAGRMAFSEFYAENVAVDVFFVEERFRTDTYPDFRTARTEVEAQLGNSATVPGTVLYTLQPTVTLLQEGGKKLLQKGVYVVK